MGTDSWINETLYPDWGQRFRVTRGTLLDLMNAEDTYFQIALTYIQAVTQRDAQKLVLLQREGQLLRFFGLGTMANVK